MSDRILDPFDSATEAGERGNVFFGKIDCTAQFVKLVKGLGKTLWMENDGDGARRTELNIHLNPLDVMNLTRPVERSVIAESRDFSAIVWPSLRALGVKNAREIHGKWAKVELVKTGRTYTNGTGATIENTTVKFHALYSSEAECIAAWETETGGSAAGSGSQHQQQAETDDVEKAAALQFLPALVKAANGDKAQLAQSIATMPIIAKHFTVDSPEVQVLLQAA